MSEEIKTNNNPEDNNQEKPIPTWVGLVVIIALVGSFIFFFWKFQKINEENKSIVNSKSTTEQVNSKNPPVESTVDSVQSGTQAEVADQEDDTGQVSGSSIDIDYELKKLDESANTMNENNFNSANFSDANLGL